MPEPKPAAKKITLAELKKRAKAGDLSEKELKAFFELDEKKTKPFKLVVKLTERVDVGTKRPSADEVAALLDLATNKASEKDAPAKPDANTVLVDRFATGRPKPKGLAAKTTVGTNRVLVEGDSWFHLPFFFPKDAVDFLRETFDVSSIALFGDTVENMLKEKQYVQKLKPRNFRHFLFSGGGNDVLASIGKFVLARKPGDTDPAHAPDYVDKSFETKVANIIKGYRTLATDVRATVGSTVTIYVHGYGNAFPLAGGKYLGGPLLKLGFDAVAHDKLSAAIVAHMVKMFNEALQAFAASHAGVVYVDLRDAMKNKGDWHTDEIHPKATGAKKIANALADAIKANTPVA
jgi:lysophospholipase L1-like esterase